MYYFGNNKNTQMYNKIASTNYKNYNIQYSLQILPLNYRKIQSYFWNIHLLTAFRNYSYITDFLYLGYVNHDMCRVISRKSIFFKNAQFNSINCVLFYLLDNIKLLFKFIISQVCVYNYSSLKETSVLLTLYVLMLV